MIPTPVELLGPNFDAGTVEKYLVQIEKQMWDRKNRDMSLCITVPPEEQYVIKIVKECIELKGWDVTATGMGISKTVPGTHIEFVVRPLRPVGF